MYPTSTDALRNLAPREREGVFFGYAGAVCVVAICVLALRLPSLERLDDSGSTYWLLAALAVLADLRPLTPPGLRPTAIVFPSVCFTFAILLMWGFAEAVVVQTATVIVLSVRLRHAPWRAAFNAAQYAVSFGVAAAVLSLADGRPFAPGGQPDWLDIVVALAAAAAWFAVSYSLVTTLIYLRFGGSWWRLLVGSVVDDALTTGSLLLLAPVLVGATHASPWLVPLVMVPLLAVNRMANLARAQARAAATDPLTGLANRDTLMSRVAGQISACANEPEPSCFALLVLDIDRFKYVNDALGHEVGDRLLVEVGRRLSAGVRHADTVARLGGDEFAIVAPEAETAEDAVALAAQIGVALSAPLVLDGLSLDVGGSIGIAMFPAHGEDFATLLRHADIAMYEAKNRGDATAVYTPEADQNSRARLGLLADLRQALEDPASDEVAFYYQPQIEIASGEVVGVEALLRWRHPRTGMVDPEELIKVAEHSGVMRLLTLRVIDDVVAQLAKWRAEGITIRAAVNVSVRDLHTTEIVDRLDERLREYDVPADQVQFEITEGALMADPRRVLVTLQRLALLGVALSLDDFGTGYSSMQHLRRLPLAEVKIDRSFVLGMAADADDEAIVRSIIDLASSLNLRVVAEGVEDDPTRRLLLAAGCEVAQGWFYARPMPADDLASWLTRYRPPQQQLTWPPGGAGGDVAG